MLLSEQLLILSNMKKQNGIGNMKYIINITVLLLLTSLCVNAQINKENPYELSKQKIVDSKIKSETQWKINLNDPSQKKSKVSYKEYDLKGQLVKTIVYGEGDSVLTEGVLSYDEKGRLAGSSTKRGKAGTVRNIYSYNDDDKLSRTETYDESNKLIASMTHIYNADGRLDQLETIGADNKVRLLFKYQYDEKGNMVEVGTQDLVNKINSKGIFHYDENNKLVSQLTYDNNGKLIQSLEKKYDADGKLSGEVVKNANSQVISQETYIVDSSGNHLEKVVVNPAAKISKKIKSNYTDKNIITDQTIYNKLNEPVTKIIYDYEHY